MEALLLVSLSAPEEIPLTWSPLLMLLVVLASRPLLKLLLVVLQVIPVVPAPVVVTLTAVAVAVTAVISRLPLFLGLMVRSAIVLSVSMTHPLTGFKGEALFAVAAEAVAVMFDTTGDCFLVVFIFEVFAPGAGAGMAAALEVVADLDSLVAEVEAVWEEVPVLLAMQEAFLTTCLGFLFGGICIVLFNVC